VISNHRHDLVVSTPARTQGQQHVECSQNYANLRAPTRLHSSVVFPGDPPNVDLWVMLKEERQAAQEQQAHLRTKDDEFRSLLEKKDEEFRCLLEKKDEDLRSKDEDLRSKDEDLRSKDEELRRLLEKKDEDIRTKDEDIRTKDTLLATQAQKISEMSPLISHLQWRQFELMRYKNIVDCRGALEFVASQHDIRHAGDENAWQLEFDGALNNVLTSCNAEEKIVQDNGGRRHTSASLAAKVKAIWKRMSSDLHIGEKFKHKGTKVVLRTNGLSHSDVLTLSSVFNSIGIDAEIQS